MARQTLTDRKVQSIKAAAKGKRGRGFMGYGIALKRLKAALIPMLQQGRPIGGMFHEVFR
jgi:hypothetical protein